MMMTNKITYYFSIKLILIHVYSFYTLQKSQTYLRVCLGVRTTRIRLFIILFFLVIIGVRNIF